MCRATIILAIMLTGCSSGFGPKSVSSEDPSSKIPAIKQSVNERDLGQCEQLIKDLDSDDPAVRFYSIGGLQRLTGQTFDYHYYDDETQRAPAIARWKAWLAERNSSPATTQPE